jgi:nicotinamide riboside kinase
MKIHPPVYFEKTKDGQNTTIQIDWTFYNFTILGNKSVAEGYKSSYIRTQINPHQNASQKYTYDNVSFLNISTNYVDAWNQSLNWLKDQHKFDENITIQKGDQENLVYIKIRDEDQANINLTVNIEVVDINVQIGIGTIMQYPNKD